MKKKRLSAIAAAALAALLLASCGSSGGSNGGGAYNSAYDEAYEAAEWYEPEELAGVSSSPSRTAAASDSKASGGTEQTAKIIRSADLELETTEFEQSADALADLVERMEGYFSDSTYGDRGGGSRWANYTVRVPEKHFQPFLDQAGELCHETWRHASQEDVSEFYYDTQGRLKTQQIKLTRLQALLEQAEAMEDIITIESAISETEQEIDELSGTLRHYDNLVDYATISISLQEVYRLSNVEPTPDSYASRLGSAFGDGLRDFGGWLEDLTVALAYGWLWLLLLAGIVAGCVALYRRRKGQKAAGPLFQMKKAAKEEKQETKTE